METEKLIESIRCCGSSPNITDCKWKCAFYNGGDMATCIPHMTNEAANVLERIAAERDAAVRGLAHYCNDCKYFVVTFNGCTPDYDCKYPDVCVNNDCWEWRGIRSGDDA